MTIDELLALPDSGTDRWLIDGHLRECRGGPRPPGHCRTATNVIFHLSRWADETESRGEVLSNPGFFLSIRPSTIVGIDVAYITEETIRNNPDDDAPITGTPEFAVEIAAPTDVPQQLEEKIAACLRHGTPLAWLIDPQLQTVTVHRPDAKPQLFNVSHTLDAAPHLPDFRLPVADIFAR